MTDFGNGVYGLGERYAFRGGGTTLNFMSDRRGGAGSYDLWQASRAR